MLSWLSSEPQVLQLQVHGSDMGLEREYVREIIHRLNSPPHIGAPEHTDRRVMNADRHVETTAERISEHGVDDPAVAGHHHAFTEMIINYRCDLSEDAGPERDRILGVGKRFISPGPDVIAEDCGDLFVWQHLERRLIGRKVLPRLVFGQFFPNGRHQSMLIGDFRTSAQRPAQR